MERKWLIAIAIIVIVLVGVLGWYFFLRPQGGPSTGPMLYVDGVPYSSAQITWDLNATPGTTLYSLHEVNNPGNGTVYVYFNYTTSFYNSTTAQMQQIYNGSQWLINNSNLTDSLVLGSGTLIPLMIQLSHRQVNELSTYHVFINFTDQVLNVKFEYPGDQPAVDGQTVFTYLGFDGDNNNKLDGSDKAFNFTSNPNRANANMLQEYTPANNSTTAWNATATGTWSWNGTNLPDDAPVSVSISEDRKDVTWTIPFALIGASKDSVIGMVVQAFGYDFYPPVSAEFSTTPPTPDNYKKLDCHFPVPETQFKFAVDPQTTVKFFVKVTFFANSIPGTKYSFTFVPLLVSK